MDPLNAAVERSDLDLVRSEIKNGADVNKPWFNRTPLHRAVGRNLQIVQVLIENGADVFAQYYNDSTILHFACSCGTVDSYNIIKLLLEKGLDCNARDLQGITPLLTALCFSNNPENVKLLIDHGANIAVLDQWGGTALHYAARNRLVDMVEIVFNQGFDYNIDCWGRFGLSPLEEAVVWTGSPEVCEFLMKRGANVNKRDLCRAPACEMTPLIFAVTSRRQSVETVRILLNYGASVSNSGIIKSVLREALGSDKSIKKLLIRKIVEMDCLNLSIRDDDRQLIEQNHDYKSYYEEYRQTCLQELHNMKETKFYENVSVYRILMGSKKEICGYARNNDLIEAWEIQDYEDQFPIFYSSLNERFNAEVIDKQRLRNTTGCVLSIILKLNVPSHPINQKILYYLKDEDLALLNV